MFVIYKSKYQSPLIPISQNAITCDFRRLMTHRDTSHQSPVNSRLKCITENADAADASRGVGGSQVKIDDVILEHIF